MGSAMRTFRLVKAVGAACEHHLLVRAGRPSYPNADQGAEDAADAFPELIMDALTAWWTRWLLPARCRGADRGPGSHQLVVVAEPVEVGHESLALHDTDGMQSLDVWLAHRRNSRGAVLSTDPHAEAFHVLVENDDRAVGPAVQLNVLLLAEASGDGDLRDV